MTKGEARILMAITVSDATARFLKSYEFDPVSHFTEEEAQEYLYCQYVLGMIALSDIPSPEDRKYIVKREREENNGNAT